MTDGFAPPPTPDGAPAGTVRRADFRPAPPARRRSRFPLWLKVLLAAGGVVIIGGVVTQVALTARSSNLTPADRDTTGRLHSAQVVSGMCLETLSDEAGTVRVVACEQSHAAEVVTAYEFAGDEFPGDADAATTVLAYCASQLAPGAPLADAADGREWLAWVPSADTWQGGDRSGLCIVTASEPWKGAAASN
jgi:hypothetical protein